MNPRPAPPGSGPAAGAEPPAGRRSYALESMSHRLASLEGLQIIDLGGINQANLDYVTGMGHRLYADDLLRAYDTFFTAQERAAAVFEAPRVEAFLDDALDFPDQSADGALVWDTLQFLPSKLAQAVLDRLYRVLAPDSLLLALFHPESAGAEASPQRCRALDHRHLQLTPRPSRRQIETYSPRSIERAFGRFQTVKFFLTRENLQEVIARR